MSKLDAGLGVVAGTGMVVVVVVVVAVVVVVVVVDMMLGETWCFGTRPDKPSFLT
jgi:hypothetical protein